MRHPVTRELFAYWDALRAGRSAPERSAIDPAAIRNLLAFTFLLEVGEPAGPGPGFVSFRLSGTRLNALFRRELKGAAFAGIWVEDVEDEVSAIVDGVFGDCRPVVAGVLGSPNGYEPVPFELLLMPLRHYGRTHARLLGSIVAETAPSWIGLRAIEGFRLASFRTLLPRDGGRLGTFGVAANALDPGPTRASADATAVQRGVVPTRTGPFRVYEGGRTAARPDAAGAAMDRG